MRKKLIGAGIIAALAMAATVAVGAFITTSMGEQAVVTPQLRITGPSDPVKVGEPIPVRVAYTDFDLKPALRCNPAGPCTGSTPQVVVDGLVQGHIHVYFQKIDGLFGNVDSDSFCIPTNIVLNGTGGVVSGNCPAVTVKGLYRMSAEFQSNSHVALLKATNKPQDVPTTDNLNVRVIP